MGDFRFAILGAAKIADKFCDAVSRIPGCRVVAVASKSMERAEQFAKKNGLSAFYDSYERMLTEEKPDAAYIAVTPNDHARLTQLCIAHHVPVLCEKAMFLNSAEARETFDAAKKEEVFVMEALWSRFLPAVNRAKEWLDAGRIGEPATLECAIGFRAPDGAENRYWNPRLGGGAARDITVYAYEITSYLVGQPARDLAVFADRSGSGVDATDHVFARFGGVMASLTTTFAARMDQRMILSGSRGRIVIPSPHTAMECMLYDETGAEAEHFRDTETENGFVYEIREVMDCVRKGCLQSRVNPWEDTIACAEVFDRIDQRLEEAERQM